MSLHPTYIARHLRPNIRSHSDSLHVIDHVSGMRVGKNYGKGLLTNIKYQRNISARRYYSIKSQHNTDILIDELYKTHKYPHPKSFGPIDTPHFKFELIHQSTKSKARVGRIHTPHGIIDTPGYVPVGTNGALKYVDLQTAIGIGTQLMFCNTFHLLIHPGPEVVEAAGGIHKYINYNAPIITDSGGFQVFSLSNTQNQDELKGKAVKGTYSSLLKKSNEEGVEFRSYKDGRLIKLTPESSVQAQKMFGSDIIIPLDILLPNNAPPKKVISSFHRTHRWEARSLKVHEEDVRKQAMYSVIHGGIDESLRGISVSYLSKLPFQGMAIGGSLGRNKEEMYRLLSSMKSFIPEHLPIHLLGIGDPESVDETVKYGMDTFDSTYPTKSGRHGRLFSENGHVDLGKSANLYKHDEQPVKGCKCHTCMNYSLAYLHHLNKMNEPMGMTLGAIHNIHFMVNKMKTIREKIMANEI